MENLNDRRRKLLGQRIRMERVAAGLSQRSFAPIAGTNQSYLWEVESGRVNASVDFLCRVADALGVRVADLIDF